MCKTAVPKALTRVVSWDELAKHASPTDLWVAVEGLVYDVTAWRMQHPGGWRLLEVRVLTPAGGGEDWGAYGCLRNYSLAVCQQSVVTIGHRALIESPYVPLLAHSRVSPHDARSSGAAKMPLVSIPYGTHTGYACSAAVSETSC